MSLADPITATVGATPYTLPLTSREGDETEYTTADGNVKIRVSHDSGKGRIRRMFRIDYSKISADTFRPDENVRRSMSSYIVVDVPEAGFTAAEIKDVVKALTGVLTASSDAVLTKVIAGES